MTGCWEYLPQNRPNFSKVSKSLKHLIKMKETNGRNEGTGTLNRAVNIHKLKAMSSQIQ